MTNDHGDIVHVHGQDGAVPELAEGQARTNVVDMAREGLPHELSALIRQASASDTEAVRQTCVSKRTVITH
ncbi:MAG: hypothetical protein R3C28_26280 [Pirellulaceae bacterium]